MAIGTRLEHAQVLLLYYLMLQEHIAVTTIQPVSLVSVTLSQQ